jgi:carbonic anhydrase/acetyltransferase-like protein (isoleucine patch superfamily)
MGAIIMDWAEIGDGCCIGAGALVTEKSIIPPYKLALGVPAQVVADISDKMRKALEAATGFYIALPPRCLSGMREIAPEEVIQK